MNIKWKKKNESKKFDFNSFDLVFWPTEQHALQSKTKNDFIFELNSPDFNFYSLWKAHQGLNKSETNARNVKNSEKNAKQKQNKIRKWPFSQIFFFSFRLFFFIDRRCYVLEVPELYWSYRIDCKSFLVRLNKNRKWKLKKRKKETKKIIWKWSEVKRVFFSWHGNTKNMVNEQHLIKIYVQSFYLDRSRGIPIRSCFR